MCDFEDNLQYFCNNVSKHFYPSIKDEDVKIEKSTFALQMNLKLFVKNLA